MKAGSEEAFERSCEARDAFWGTWGDLDPNVLAPLINPAFKGGPRWPSLRQAFRGVRRGSLTLVATDGLSDPFDDDPTRAKEQGLAIECFAVTKDAIPPALKDSWLLDLVLQVSLNAADHGGWRGTLDRLGLLSMQFFDVRVPDEWRNEDGTVGVLLNQQDSGPAGVRGSMQLPLGDVLAVNVKLLTPAELSFGVKNGAAGRAELARRFLASGEGQRSGLSRRSVV